MVFKGIQKERKKWVYPLAFVLVILIVVRSIFAHAYIYILFAALVFVAIFYRKEMIIDDDGADIRYRVFGYHGRNLWTWDRITLIRIDHKKAQPNMLVHVARDVVIRDYVLTPSEVNDLCKFAKKKNSRIRIEHE